MNDPPDLATTIAPDGGEVRATPSTKDTTVATAKRICRNILEKFNASDDERKLRLT